jgi:hypothetical protein
MTGELDQGTDERRKSMRFMCDGMLMDGKKVLEGELKF